MHAEMPTLVKAAAALRSFSSAPLCACILSLSISAQRLHAETVLPDEQRTNGAETLRAAAELRARASSAAVQFRGQKGGAGGGAGTADDRLGLHLPAGVAPQCGPGAGP